MPRVDTRREPMPKLDPSARRESFDEVAVGYEQATAEHEASRCILCPRQPCVGGCPVGIDIPQFIKALREKDMPAAVRILKSKNSLPGICGRVCPQESQCERQCVIGKLGAPIAIGRLERYVADWEMAHGPVAAAASTSSQPSGKRVAVVGSGPAGLTASADLAKLGHQVTIFESLHTPGGVLAYGIPEFRLPQRIVKSEVEYVCSLGVELRLNWVVGKTITIDEMLSDSYQAVFLGTGAGLPQFLNLHGENYGGIYSSNEFLTRINLMKAHLFPSYRTPINIGQVVAVIGGGNVAMDSARCALRSGAREVYLVYRRSRTEMPARDEEIENALEEGVIFKLLTNPRKFLGNDHGQVTGMECVEMELGEPDQSGRRRPVVKQGSEFVMKVDTVVVAVGTTPHPLVPSTTPGLTVSAHGTIAADEGSGRTTRAAVWAGGDATTGSATVISAMGAGRRAAAAIDRYLREGMGG
jgi:glutamate synthase (NADPH) small chain